MGSLLTCEAYSASTCRVYMPFKRLCMELVSSFDNCTMFTFDNIQTNNDDDDLLHMMNTYYFIYL